MAKQIIPPNRARLRAELLPLRYVKRIDRLNYNDHSKKTLTSPKTVLLGPEEGGATPVIIGVEI